jgi:hypothetical protein
MGEAAGIGDGVKYPELVPVHGVTFTQKADVRYYGISRSKETELCCGAESFLPSDQRFSAL